MGGGRCGEPPDADPPRAAVCREATGRGWHLARVEGALARARAQIDAMRVEADAGRRSRGVKVEATTIFGLKARGLIAAGEPLGRADGGRSRGGCARGAASARRRLPRGGKISGG